MHVCIHIFSEIVLLYNVIESLITTLAMVSWEMYES